MTVLNKIIADRFCDGRECISPEMISEISSEFNSIYHRLRILLSCAEVHNSP